MHARHLQDLKKKNVKIHENMTFFLGVFFRENKENMYCSTLLQSSSKLVLYKMYYEIEDVE